MSRALRSLRAPVALAVALALGGCFSDRPTEPEGTAPVSFADDVEPILAGSCASSGCHGTTNPNPGNKPLVLAMGQAYANIVGVASGELPSMNRITVGDPDKSYLIHKLQGTHTSVGGSGSQMPLGQAPLSQSRIDQIRKWAKDGALRN